MKTETREVREAGLWAVQERYSKEDPWRTDHTTVQPYRAWAIREYNRYWDAPHVTEGGSYRTERRRGLARCVKLYVGVTSE